MKTYQYIVTWQGEVLTRTLYFGILAQYILPINLNISITGSAKKEGNRIQFKDEI